MTIIKTCLTFASVADQMYGSEDRHLEVRQDCMDYINAHKDFFCCFLTDSETFEAYVKRKRQPNAFGNALEIQGIADLYKACIDIFESPCIST